MALQRSTADKGNFASLFDFSFTSFVHQNS